MHITPELEAELNATPVETAVDKVLDGIDAAKVREALIKAIDNTPIPTWINEYERGLIADKLLEKFIITPRS